MCVSHPLERLRHLVVERAPFGVDDHLRVHLPLVRRELAELLHLDHECTVRASAEDGTAQRMALLVCGREQRADGVVDERRDLDRNLLPLQRRLQQPRHVLADRARRREALGPVDQLALIQRRLLDREREGERKIERRLGAQMTAVLVDEIADALRDVVEQLGRWSGLELLRDVELALLEAELSLAGQGDLTDPKLRALDRVAESEAHSFRRGRERDTCPSLSHWARRERRSGCTAQLR